MRRCWDYASNGLTSVCTLVECQMDAVTTVGIASES